VGRDMAENPHTLINRLRDALALHPQNLSTFLGALTPEEQQEIRQMMILGEELHTRGFRVPGLSTHFRPDFKDPVDELEAEFSGLLFRAQTRLTTHGREQVFGLWMDILTRTLGSRKSTVMLRWLQMSPTMSKNKFAEMIAKENEAFPLNEQEGWTSAEPDVIRRLINAELKKLRDQEEPPHLTVIEGWRKTP
jgi:hypothetical protein